MGGRGKTCILLGGMAVGLLAGGAGAESPGRSVIAGVASAQGVRATIRATGFIVEELADSGGPVSQALVDLQDSKSFASLPYPGENAVAFPGVVAAVGGPTLPAYPFYASASTSAPEQDVVDPSGRYRLHATAAPGSAAGEARVAGGGDEPVSGGWSSAAVLTRDDGTTSRAEAVLRGLDLGSGALRIASLRSFSETIYKKDAAAPTTVSELLIEGGSAGPVSFTYGPDGLRVAQQGVPLPAGEGLAALNKALTPAGLSVSIARGQEVAGGRSSEALVVEQAGDIANGSRSFIHYRIGEATSAVVLGDSLAVPSTVPEPPPVADASGGAGIATSEAPIPASEPGGTASLAPAPARLPFVSSSSAGSGLPTGGLPVATPPRPTVSPAVGTPDSLVAGSLSNATLAFQVTPRRISATEPLTGLIVVGAAAMVALALLWTKRGAITP